MKTEWFESWFESDLYDLMYQHRDDKEARAFLSKLLNVLEPKEDAFFLDLACGTGRHARFIHKKGFSVTGIDLSQRKISKALNHQTEDLEFFIQDMRKPFRINYFDYVLNLFTSFGYFDDIKDNHRVIKSVKSSLKKNGVFVIDYLNGAFIKNSMIADEEKSFGQWNVKINKSIVNNRLTKSMHWTNGDLVRNYAEKVTLFSLDEIQRMLIDQGFDVINVYGDYDLNVYDENNSPRLIIVSTCSSN